MIFQFDYKGYLEAVSLFLSGVSYLLFGYAIFAGYIIPSLYNWWYRSSSTKINYQITQSLAKSDESKSLELDFINGVESSLSIANINLQKRAKWTAVPQGSSAVVAVLGVWLWGANLCISSFIAGPLKGALDSFIGLTIGLLSTTMIAAGQNRIPEAATVNTKIT